MNYKFQYLNEIERQTILDNNNDKFLIEEDNYFNNENYLIFSDVKPLEVQLQEIKNNMDIIILKQEGLI